MTNCTTQPICLLHDRGRGFSVLTHAYMARSHSGLLYQRDLGSHAPHTASGWNTTTTSDSLPDDITHNFHNSSASTPDYTSDDSIFVASPTTDVAILTEPDGSGSDDANVPHTLPLSEGETDASSDSNEMHCPGSTDNADQHRVDSESARIFGYRDNARRFRYLHTRTFHPTIPLAPLSTHHLGYLTGNMTAHNFSCLFNHVHTTDAGTLTEQLASHHASPSTHCTDAQRDILLHILEHADAARAGREPPRDTYDARTPPNMIIFPFNTRLRNKVPIAKILQQHKHLLPLTTGNPMQGHKHSKSLGRLFFNHTTVSRLDETQRQTISEALLAFA